MESPLLNLVLESIDERKLRMAVRRYVSEMTDKTLAEWSESSRLRALAARFGKDDAQELAVIAADKLIDDLMEKKRR